MDRCVNGEAFWGEEKTVVGELTFHKCKPHSVSRGLSLLLLLALAPRGFLRFLRFAALLKPQICVISKSIRNPKITCLLVIRMLCATLVVLLFYQQLFLVSEIDGLSTLPTTHFQSISSQGGMPSFLLSVEKLHFSLPQRESYPSISSPM